MGSLGWLFSLMKNICLDTMVPASLIKGEVIPTDSQHPFGSKVIYCCVTHYPNLSG